MRVVGGRLRGRPLAGPSDDAIRPTSDRLRESIFNVLEHGYDDVTAGARVLDLFAGTGAMGLEALSRGATYATFVDESSRAIALIRTNLDKLGLSSQARLLRRDAGRLGPAGSEPPATLLFCDPPYARALARPALERAAAGGWLAPGALAVIEEKAGCAPVLPVGFELVERRVWGDTEVVFARIGEAPLTQS